MKNTKHGGFFLPLITVLSLFVGGLRRQFCTANDEGTTGRHSGSTTKLADAAFATRHLLVKIGSDSDHVNVTGAGDRPYGVTDDCPAAGGDPINVRFLTASHGTKRLVATGAIAEDVDVYTAPNGQVQPLPVAAGNYWHVGRTVRAAAQAGDGNYYVEVETYKPSQVVVE